ncbi:hypothetical protein RUM43_001613 [Polyplax serrata]|uniref:Uncharacterized protein n=1 Tax=Polyplax serrata TaxID=468196 RepID=A0AAN8SI55_POLSC
MTGEKIRPCRASGRLAGLGDGQAERERGKDEQRQREAIRDKPVQTVTPKRLLPNTKAAQTGKQPSAQRVKPQAKEMQKKKLSERSQVFSLFFMRNSLVAVKTKRPRPNPRDHSLVCVPNSKTPKFERKVPVQLDEMLINQMAASPKINSLLREETPEEHN